MHGKPHHELDSNVQEFISRNVPAGYWVAIRFDNGFPRIVASGETELEARLLAQRSGAQGAVLVRVPES